MALSNYDTFAMNEMGKSCKGEFVSPLGIKVKVYKDCLHVEDEFGWQKEGVFREPTVMDINISCLVYKDVNIICTQRPTKHCDNTTLFCVWNGWECDNTMNGIVGVCQFGNIQPDAIKELHEALISNFNSDYYIIPELFKLIDLSKGKRFNQGDMCFHDKIGTDKQCTLLGKSKNTTFGKIFSFEGSN